MVKNAIRIKGTPRHSALVFKVWRSVAKLRQDPKVQSGLAFEVFRIMAPHCVQVKRYPMPFRFRVQRLAEHGPNRAQAQGSLHVIPVEASRCGEAWPHIACKPKGSPMPSRSRIQSLEERGHTSRSDPRVNQCHAAQGSRFGGAAPHCFQIQGQPHVIPV